MASDWEWLKVEIMYRSSSPGLAGKKWQKNTKDIQHEFSNDSSLASATRANQKTRMLRAVSQGLLVLFFLQSNIHCLSKPSTSRQLLRCQLKSSRRFLKRSHLPSHRFRWPAKGSPFCFWTLGIAICSLLHCVISARTRGSPPRRQAVKAHAILCHGGTLSIQQV